VPHNAPEGKIEKNDLKVLPGRTMPRSELNMGSFQCAYACYALKNFFLAKPPVIFSIGPVQSIPEHLQALQACNRVYHTWHHMVRHEDFTSHQMPLQIEKNFPEGLIF